jgi:hypothetical protein
MPTRRTWRHAALIAAIACVALALGCGLGSVAVQQGVLKPPNVNMELGGVRVVGITSNSPECTRLVMPGCAGLQPADVTRIYTLWLFRQTQRDSWSRPNVTQLLSVRIGR